MAIGAMGGLDMTEGMIDILQALLGYRFGDSTVSPRGSFTATRKSELTAARALAAIGVVTIAPHRLHPDYLLVKLAREG